MSFRKNFRDLQEWNESSKGTLIFNTASNEAAKHYDAIVTQLCGWYVDETLGGYDKTAKLLVGADPDWILGRTLKLELELMGCLTASRLDSELAKEIEDLNEMVAKRNCSSKLPKPNNQELLHVQVVNDWSRNELKKSVLSLERLATLYPEDVLALKMNQDVNFMLGTALPMRNSLASSLARMSNKNPLLGYVHGMFAFALEESNMYPQSQAQALKALSLIPNDTWAIHNYAHCLEMQAQVEDGLKWMQDKKPDWLPCQSLACHQFWHTALFHINNNNFDDAVSLLDEEILTRCVSSCSSLDLHDASSMIYRMELVDLFGKTANKKANTREDSLMRWRRVHNISKCHTKDHLVGFNDAHYLMSFLGMDDFQSAKELIDSIDEVPSLDEGNTVVKPLLEAMYQFKIGAYDKCVDLMEPIRFDIIKIGGSHAQRDIFEQLLLVAGLKSDKSEHQKLGQRMLLERETIHGRQTVQTQLLSKVSA